MNMVQIKDRGSPVGVNERPASLNSDAEFDSFEFVTKQGIFADTQSAYDNIRTLLGSYSGGPVSRDLKTSLIASIQTLSSSPYAKIFMRELNKTTNYAKIERVIDLWRLNGFSSPYIDGFASREDYVIAKGKYETAGKAYEKAVNTLSNSRSKAAHQKAQNAYCNAHEAFSATIEPYARIGETYYGNRITDLEQAKNMATANCRGNLITEGALLVWKEVLGRLPGDKIEETEEYTVRAPCSDLDSLEERTKLRVEFTGAMDNGLQLPQGFEELSSARL